MVALSFLTVLMAAAALLLLHVRSRFDTPKAVSGTPLPRFVLTTTFKTRVSSDALKGRKYVLIFSREQCAHCRQALPVIDRFLRPISETELPRWVVTEGTLEAAAAFRRRLKLGLPFTTTTTAWTFFGVSRVPTMLLVDVAGRIHGAWTGAERTANAARRLSVSNATAAGRTLLRLEPPLPPCSSCER